MTMTETPADTPQPGRAAPTALESAVSTTDHLSLGRAWIGSGAILIVVSLVAGLLVSLERMDLDGLALFASPDALFQFWSAHRVGLVLLGLLPVLVGLGTAVVPLQVGASSIVFPRAAALGYWVWALGAVVTVVGFLADGGLGTPGWGAREQAVELTLLGLLLVLAGICCATVCLVTTIVTGRTGGMSLDRVPFLSWTMLVAGSIWLVTLPVLAANAVLVLVDLRGRPAIGFGEQDAIWEQLAWVFSHPQVYAFALPLLGIAADIVPVAARRRQANHRVLLVLTGLLGAVSFGAYAQPAFDLGTPIREEAVFVVGAFLAVPLVLLVLAGLVGTLGRGMGSRRTRMPAPLYLSLLAVLLLVDGAVVGALRAVAPLDLLGTSATGAQMTFTVGAAIVGAMAGTLWWGDRVVGRVAPVGFGLASGLLAALGALLAALPDTISGFMGLADFTGGTWAAAGSPDRGVEALNAVAMVGWLVLLVGTLGWVVTGLLRMKGDRALPDTWGGHTLEWSTGPVEVTSDRPLLDAMAEAGS